MSAPLVADASVVFKWMLPGSAEQDADAAGEVLRAHAEGRLRVHVPALLFYEIGNILVRGRTRVDAPVADQALLHLHGLRLEVVHPGPGPAARAAEMARAHGLSFYDAAYVALAESLDCALVTSDSRLARRCSALGFVRLLGRDRIYS